MRLAFILEIILLVVIGLGTLAVVYYVGHHKRKIVSLSLIPVQTLSETPSISIPSATSNPIPTITPEIDTSIWNTYRNEEYGFEFTYENNWQLEKQSNSIELKPISNDKPEEISISINIITNRPKDYTLAGWLLQAGNKDASCDFTKTINKINWCGLDSERFEAVRVDDYAVNKNNIDYDVQFRIAYGRQRMDYYVSDKELSQEINTLNQILSTFKFIK